MDKGFALKNICTESNFFEQKQRYLPGDYATDCLDGDLRSSAVTRYFRQIGLHALLSHEDEVKIAKRIEAAENEILRVLLQSTVAIKHIVDLAEKINNGEMRAERVLRALRIKKRPH